MATYKTKDLPGFEHLLVVGEAKWGTTVGPVVDVSTLINTSVVIGDRELRINLPTGALWISANSLEKVNDSEAQHEFAVDSPYGEFKYEGRLTKDTLTAAYSVFELATSISIYETRKLGPDATNHKTLYAASFFANRKQALDLVEDTLHDDLDLDDLIFELEKLKETDTNG